MRVTRNSSRNAARESTGRQPAPIAHASGGRPHRCQRENAAGLSRRRDSASLITLSLPAHR